VVLEQQGSTRVGCELNRTFGCLVSAVGMCSKGCVWVGGGCRGRFRCADRSLSCGVALGGKRRSNGTSARAAQKASLPGICGVAASVGLSHSEPEGRARAFVFILRHGIDTRSESEI
jgi:hypothetical protein